MALVLEERGRPPQLDEVEVDEPQAGEVLVRMVAAGLCHTDLAYVRDARVVPMILGHEGVGVVERVGPGTKAPSPGRQVVLSWRTPCRQCRRCLAGQVHLCESPLGTAEPRLRWKRESITPMSRTGCFCEYVVVAAEAAVEVPATLAPDVASLLGCAVPTGAGAALRTVAMEPWNTVSVWGTGAVGLNIVAGARLAGVETIIAVDVDPERLRMATARGASIAISPDDAERAIRVATDGRGVDFAFEASGRQEVMGSAYATLAAGGDLVVVSALPRNAIFSLPPRVFGSSQQRVVGCVYGSTDPSRDIPLFASWYLSGRLPLDDLISGHIPFRELAAAFRRPPPGIRNIIVFGRGEP